MAFSNNATRNTNAADDSWKAQGFINLYLPSKDGKRRKLGAIPLKTNKASEAELLAFLEKDPANMAKVLSSLIAEYQSAEPAAGSGFVLG